MEFRRRFTTSLREIIVLWECLLHLVVISTGMKSSALLTMPTTMAGPTRDRTTGHGIYDFRAEIVEGWD